MDRGAWLATVHGVTKESELGCFHVLAIINSAGTWEQPRCPSADEWIRKLWYIYTMEYYSAIKKNTFESVLVDWRRQWHPTPVLLPGKSQGAWWAAVHGVARVGHD